MNTAPEIETVAKPSDNSATAEVNAELAAQDELLRVKPTMESLGLNELSLASIAILKRIHSPIIDGVPASEIENLPLELSKVLLIQQADLLDDEVLDSIMSLVKDPDRLEAEALKASRNIEGNLISLYLTVLDMIRRSNLTAIRVLPKKASKSKGSSALALHEALSDRPKA